MKVYIFICARVQHKNKYTFSNYTFSNMKTLFALLVTHKEKRQSRMPVNLKKTEFAPAGVQAKSSSCTFHPKVFNLKNYTSCKANSYINTIYVHRYIHIYILGDWKVTRYFKILIICFLTIFHSINELYIINSDTI